MNNIPWSEQEKEALRKIAEHGGTIKDALVILNGRTRPAITSQVATLGVSLAGEAREINEEAFRRFLKERGNR